MSKTAPRRNILFRARSLLRFTVATLLAVALLTIVVDGPASARTSRPPRITKPSAPTDVTAVGLYGGAGVSWRAPVSDGGSPITGYTVTATAGGGSCTTTTAMSCSVTGFTNLSRYYTISVKAANAKGLGKAAKVKVMASSAQDCSYIGAGANLQNCNLDGADLAGADLAAADLSQASLNGANLDGANLSSANLTMADLTGAELTGTDLNSADMFLSNLTDVDLSNDNLTDVQLLGSNLTGVDLTGATLTGVSSGSIDGTPVGLPANWEFVNGYLVGPDANLTGSRFIGDELTGLDLGDAQLSQADLSGCDLNGTDLGHAGLTAVTSGGITGTPASLPPGWMLIDGYLIGDSANLTDAELSGADLTGADLAGSSLGGANLSGATLTDVSSGEISGSPAQLPTNWALIDGYLIGPGADLASSNLRGVQMTLVDLDGANLTNADLAGANLADTSMIAADLSGSDLSGAAFGGVNLSGADLSGADLTSARLGQSDLSGADLAGTQLSGVSSGFITGTPSALPSDWSLVGGFLIGPEANLTSSSLVDVDLSGLDFAGANLTDGNLTGSNLTGADLINVIWSETGCPDGTNSNNDGGTCVNNLG